MALSKEQRELASSAEREYSDLKALYLNCTLKRSPQHSHTADLMGNSIAILQENAVSVEMLRPVDHILPPGVQPDMAEEGYERDDWPGLMQKVLSADILVIGSPIWLGEKSSVCTKVIERLYAYSAQTNEKDQYLFYGKVGGCIITGNEDGIKHCSASILFALQHIGYVIPPQADSGWIGEAGPGPSYGDESDEGPPVGYDNTFTQRTTEFMAWNLLHAARMLKDAGGFPAHGNRVKEE